VPNVHKRLRDAATFKDLGLGLITGATDDDPSGIATYSQAGAQFGFGMLWTMLLTYPLMSAIQLVSAQIGRVTASLPLVVLGWLATAVMAVAAVLMIVLQLRG
jgi:Mn2+/Fe2+ NRAMP family transporter